MFQLIDMRHPATEFDISMLDFLRQSEIPYSVVLTKADKLNKGEYANRLKLIYEELGDLAEGVQIIPTSASTGAGTDIIRNIIEKIYILGGK